MEVTQTFTPTIEPDEDVRSLKYEHQNEKVRDFLAMYRKHSIDNIVTNPLPITTDKEENESRATIIQLPTPANLNYIKKRYNPRRNKGACNMMRRVYNQQDCTKYFECINYDTPQANFELRSCPDGKGFHRYMLVCLPKEQVADCSSQSSQSSQTNNNYFQINNNEQLELNDQQFQPEFYSHDFDIYDVAAEPTQSNDVNPSKGQTRTLNLTRIGNVPNEYMRYQQNKYQNTPNLNPFAHFLLNNSPEMQRLLHRPRQLFSGRQNAGSSYLSAPVKNLPSSHPIYNHQALGSGRFPKKYPQQLFNHQQQYLQTLNQPKQVQMQQKREVAFQKQFQKPSAPKRPYQSVVQNFKQNQFNNDDVKPIAEYTNDDYLSGLCQNDSIIYAHPTNCSLFFRCKGSGSFQVMTSVFECGLGTAFNVRLQVCDHVQNVPECRHINPTNPRNAYRRPFYVADPTKNKRLASLKMAPNSTEPLTTTIECLDRNLIICNEQFIDGCASDNFSNICPKLCGKC
ncbi:hypothetical protein SNEBB_008880 [Seison nebaliae]|nr:hypothetical protein SNEBB_008880 [Seison nebaliae]